MNNQVTSAAAKQVIAAAAAAAADWRWRGTVLAYTYMGGSGSVVKTYGGIVTDSPALRGAIAWALRRSGRQVEFAHGRAIGFEQD